GYSVVVRQILDAGGEPGTGRIADEEHRAVAHRGRLRNEYVVDLKVAGGRERDQIRVAQYRGGNLANQRGAHALVRVGADVVAPGQQQALPLHLDAPVRFHVRSEVGDGPELPGRLNA